MANPPFYLQISDEDGHVLRTHAGGKQEADLVDLITMHVMSRKVGLFRTTNTVRQAVKDGITDAIQAIKIRNPFDIVDE